MLMMSKNKSVVKEKSRKGAVEVDRLNLASVQDPLKRIPMLNSIALSSQRQEVSYAIELLKEALSLSEQSGIPVFLAQTNLNLSRWLGNGGFFDEAFEHLSIAKTFFRNLEDHDGLSDVQLVHALILFEKGEYEEACTIASIVYEYRKAIRDAYSSSEPVLVSADRLMRKAVTEEKSRRNNELKLAFATRILAVVEASRADYVKALYYLDANFELWERLGETQELASALSNAGMIYARIPDNASAIEFYQRALAIYKSSGAYTNMITILSNLAYIRRKIGDYTTAFTELNEAWALLQQSNNPTSGLEVSLQFVNYYIALNDLENAYDWAVKASEISEAEEAGSSKSLVFSLLGKTLFLLLRYDEAIKTLTQGLTLALETKHLEAEVRCLKYLYLAHKDLGRIDEAFRYLERFQIAESRLLQAQLASNAKAIQMRFKTRFAQTSDAVFREENQQLTNYVEHLTQELAGLMRQVRKKDEVLGKLKKETSTLINFSKETQDFLKPILKEVSEKLRDSDSEQNITEKLEGLQTHYLKQLRTTYPSLSKAEERICALLRLEMSSLEIATALHISIRTVESHRLHIRQKLKVDENESLQEVLKRI